MVISFIHSFLLIAYRKLVLYTHTVLANYHVFCATRSDILTFTYAYKLAKL